MPGKGKGGKRRARGERGDDETWLLYGYVHYLVTTTTSLFYCGGFEHRAIAAATISRLGEVGGKKW